VKIGIDISQVAYESTGVAKLIASLVGRLSEIDKENDYVLFFSSLRKKVPDFIWALKSFPNFKVKTFKFPPSFLDLLWNKLHIFPIEWLIGDVDIFVTSDWTEPPTSKAKKTTILYDLIVYKFPDETSKKIVEVQKRKLNWVKKESSMIFCISESTKKDAMEILGIDEKRLKVIYPGI
jgi:hypothetical protein